MRAKGLLWGSPSFLETAEFHFYSALAHAGCWDCVSTDQRQQHFDALAAHHKQLALWAQICPENFENRAALAGAEIARLEGRVVDAEELYERAVRSARTNNFVHNEAVANELAASFYAARGFEQIAHLYLRNARYCYLRWGADGKVRQLDQLHPHLRQPEPAPGPTSTIGAPIEHLDLATLINVSQAVASEIILEKLLDTVICSAIKHAGAERGLLILSRGADQWVAAEGTTHDNEILVELREQRVTAAMLPESVLHYVLRTRESVVLDDAAAQDSFSDDPYIRHRRARSILCLPLINQAALVGVLYLENNVTTHVFAPARIAVLKLLASQAAISLENSRLYGDLREREAKIRRLVDANIVGICIWDLEGRILDANDAFLRIVDYDREDLVSGRIRWTDLTPPEWRDSDARAVQELKMSGTAQPFEKEYWRKDGSRVPVLIGPASFEGRGNQGVAFVLDLTERKRAEAEARESERRYREVQMALAHANRVATMGQLTASIAHEVNQPIAATATNAEAALRWLARRPPQLEEVRQALTLIVKDGHRAGEVIGRIRELIKKTPPRKDRLQINEAIREVMDLTRGEAVKHGVSVRVELAEGLPLIEADRVELQQVILNLVINAVEAMGSVSEGERQLLVSTGKAEPGGVLVAVKDSGPGLAPGTLERVFDAFYSTKSGGLGMGLAICRSIIEAYQGRLWASANTPRGAIFQFTLPTCSYPERGDT